MKTTKGIVNFIKESDFNHEENHLFDADKFKKAIYKFVEHNFKGYNRKRRFEITITPKELDKLFDDEERYKRTKVWYGVQIYDTKTENIYELLDSKKIEFK